MFRLLRYFSMTSLVSIVAVAAALGWFYRDTAVRSLIAMGESNNKALTGVLANSLWPRLQPYRRISSRCPIRRAAPRCGCTCSACSRNARSRSRRIGRERQRERGGDHGRIAHRQW